MRKTISSFTLAQSDIKTLDQLSGDLGLSRSAVIRLAIKSFEQLVNANQLGRSSLGVAND